MLAHGWVPAEPSRAGPPTSPDRKHISVPVSAAFPWCPLSARMSRAARQSSAWHSRFLPRELSDVALEALPWLRWCGSSGAASTEGGSLEVWAVCASQGSTPSGFLVLLFIWWLRKPYSVVVFFFFFFTGFISFSVNTIHKKERVSSLPKIL